MADYLHDESRKTGSADAVLLPENEEEIIDILRHSSGVPLTVQGARTGLTAGSVPFGGSVLSLTRMDRILRIEPDAEVPFAVVQPGVLLQTLRQALKPYHLMFAPDPTEPTASLGGLVANNSSGARSYRYGAVRGHILGLTMLLRDGEKITLERGREKTSGLDFSLRTEEGREIAGTLPDIRMPAVKKHTAGYYIRPDMDLIDLMIGSEGTLGIVTSITVRLLPQPARTWGVLIFFDSEQKSLYFVKRMQEGAPVEAIEFFGEDTLSLMKENQNAGTMLTDSVPIPERAACAVYVEYASDSEERLREELRRLADIVSKCGGDPKMTWAALDASVLERLKEFRHDAPVSVNERISAVRQTHPGITKLASDMSVPDDRLEEVFSMYREGLRREHLRSAIYGHIGSSHLHVNILSRDMDDYERGTRLISEWAEKITAMGGSVSAEHGIGKMKTGLLQILYSEADLRAMFEIKKAFDPELLLNPGNIFPEGLK
jgi:D-lactate dehydrogenase (cytochrome)